MSENPKQVAEEIVQVRTGQKNDYFSILRSLGKALGSKKKLATFARRESERRENDPIAQYSNNIDGQVTAICHSISRGDLEMAREQILYYYSSRKTSILQNIPGSLENWSTDEITKLLKEGYFPNDVDINNELINFIKARTANSNR